VGSGGNLRAIKSLGEEMFKKVIKIFLIIVLVYSFYLLADNLKTEVSSKKRTMWQELLFEDFESGSMPSDWTVIDGNGDGGSWEVGTTDFFESETAPPDSGTAYAFYEDWSQDYASIPGEDLITPKFFTASFDSLKLIYSRGYGAPWGQDDTFRLYWQVFELGSWSSWIKLAEYAHYIAKWDTLCFWIGVNADSAQFMWRYSDHGGQNTAVGIDNVTVKGHLDYGGTHDIAVASLNSPPSLLKLDSAYPVSSTFRNLGDLPMTFDAHTEIVSSSGSPVYFSKDSSNITLLPDSSIEINFGNWIMTIADSCNYISSSTTSDSTVIDDTMGILVLADIDFETDSILMPPPYCDTNIPYDVIARFKNEGRSDYTVNLHSEITLDGNPVFTKDSLNVFITAGDSIDVNFGSVVFDEYGDYECRINTVFPYDIDFSNDSLVSTGRVSPWKIITEKPIKLWGEAVVFDGSYVYVIGGNTSDSTLKSLFIYNPVNKSWSRGSDLPAPLYQIDACLLGDTIYVPGGKTQATYIGENKVLDSLYKYSISSDTWTVSPCPRDSVVYYSCVSANGKVYKIGGYSFKTDEVVGYNWEYEPGKEWIRKTDLIWGRGYMARWVRNDTIYLAGGLGIYDGTYSSTQIYDPMNDIWREDSTFFAYLPYEVWGAHSAIYEGKVYLMGGCRDYNAIDSVLYYDYSNNSWNSYYPLLRGEIYASAVGIEGLGTHCDGIYLFGRSSKGVQALINPQPSAGISEPDEKEPSASNIIVNSNIAINAISFTYKGKKPATVVIRDVTGRVVKEYADVKPEKTLKFGGKGFSTGIYFIGVKENKESEKVVLVR
jgi:hypothetical protein